jgi:hypothetical protein
LNPVSRRAANDAVKNYAYYGLAEGERADRGEQACTADCPQRSVEAKRTDRLIAVGTFVFLKVWTGEQSSLLTRTATMESVSLFAQMKS